jgi:hypothetical protein
MNTRRVLLGLGFSVALAVTGCKSLGMGDDKSQSYPLEVSRGVPAAVGQVKVKPKDAGNQEVQVKVEHLAPADVAQPGTKVYVVWLTPTGEMQSMNAGVLPVGADRKGELKTVTPFKSFEISVTPEAKANASQPSHKPVLRAQVKQATTGMF